MAFKRPPRLLDPPADNEIRVRAYSQTYIARWRGREASCTAGPMQAARAVARKVLGRDPGLISGHGSDQKGYRYVAGGIAERGMWGWLLNPFTGQLSPRRHWFPAGRKGPICNGSRQWPVQLDIELYEDGGSATCRTCLRLKSAAQRRPRNQ